MKARQRSRRKSRGTGPAAALAGLPSEARVLTLHRLPAESERARQVSGIIFVDGPAGRRARIAGTGVDVFEVIRDYLDVSNDLDAVRGIYDLLTTEQIDAALAYYAAYPSDIDARLALEEAFANAFDRPRA